jgi:NADH:ubiquinone reductase (H+-translocating)
MLRLIILGGGFAGVKCAKTLRKRFATTEAEIIVFNEENHLVFSPMLADAVGSSLSPLDVVVPLRGMLPGVSCRTEEVMGIDRQKSEIIYESENGAARNLSFDHLVIACGNVSDLSIVPGMSDHAFPLKSVGDAIALRAHVMQQMERAEVCEDPERRRWHLRFIVVGGGYSGVEVAGEINDLVKSSARFFQNFTAEDVEVVLIHSRDQLLPEIGSSLRDFARTKMEEAGVKVRLNERVSFATPEGVGCGNGDLVRGATIVCTIGSSIAPVVAKLDAEKLKGRLVTEPDMRLRGSANIWATGDCADIVNAHDGKPSPPTGQFAERQGRQCAENIRRLVDGKPTQPFTFKVLGQLCSIGGHSAVAEMFGFQLSGFIAWFVWRGVYLFKLPSWSRRLQVGFDWGWLILFPRDLSHLRAKTTDRVSHAHYQPGEYIFRQGDAPANFYVIETGEVEILRESQDRPEGEVLALLGSGAFFGEQALINNEPRNASPRARTTVEVLVMGRNVFSQMSKALTPLRDALAKTLNRRSVNVWDKNVKARDVLRSTRVGDVVKPAPSPLLAPTATLREVARQFVDEAQEFRYVSKDGVSLDGIVTMTDLIRAHAGGLLGDAPVSTFMVRNPVVVSVDDDCLMAETVMLEHQLKWLPVVAGKNDLRIVGSVSLRRLIGHVLQILN